MGVKELRAKALHYRRVAEWVSGAKAKALLELAAEYAFLG